MEKNYWLLAIVSLPIDRYMSRRDMRDSVGMVLEA